jgi:lipopolysaccharide heptosyltransferase I
MPSPLQPSDRLLVIRLGAVGDVIRTLPAVRWIKRACPAVPIAWVVEDLSRDLLLGQPDIDEVIRFPRRELREALAHPLRAARAFAALLRILRSRRFTVAADFQGSCKSGLLALLSGARRRVGFAPGHSREASWIFTNEWVRPPVARMNRVARNLQVASALGGSDDDVTVPLPELAEDRAEADRIVGELRAGGRRVVVFSPGTSHRQRHKRWPIGHYARLASLMQRTIGVTPAIAWGPGEEEIARAIVLESGDGAQLLPPMGLRLLASVLRRADLFVGADTGPMHLAWAVGCPVVAVFGPTDPALNAPLGRGTVALRNGDSTADVAPETALDAARALLTAAAPRPDPTAAFRIPRSDLPASWGSAP